MRSKSRFRTVSFARKTRVIAWKCKLFVLQTWPSARPKAHEAERLLRIRQDCAKRLKKPYRSVRHDALLSAKPR
jgi:hypothetical protein